MRIYRKHIERIVIIGDNQDSKEAHDYCYDNGFRVTRSGPKLKRGIRMIDGDKFKIVAEREVKKDE